MTNRALLTFSVYIAKADIMNSANSDFAEKLQRESSTTLLINGDAKNMNIHAVLDAYIEKKSSFSHFNIMIVNWRNKDLIQYFDPLLASRSSGDILSKDFYIAKYSYKELCKWLI